MNFIRIVTQHQLPKRPDGEYVKSHLVVSLTDPVTGFDTNVLVPRERALDLAIGSEFVLRLEPMVPLAGGASVAAAPTAAAAGGQGGGGYTPAVAGGSGGSGQPFSVVGGAARRSSRRRGPDGRFTAQGS